MSAYPRLPLAKVRQLFPSQIVQLRRIRVCIAIVMAGLVLSGLTALPLVTESRLLSELISGGPIRTIAVSLHLVPWLNEVSQALIETGRQYPFLAYGTDWLAFAHLILAIAFIGAYRDPVRNRWLVTFGLIACAAVVPMAWIAGSVRGIPFAWRIIDCSFGMFAAFPLYAAMRSIQALERLHSSGLPKKSAKSATSRRLHIHVDDARDWLH